MATLPLCLQGQIKDYCPPKAPGNIPYDILEKAKNGHSEVEAIITNNNWNTELITHDGRGGLSHEYALTIDVDLKNKKMLDAIVKNRIRIKYKHPTQIGGNEFVGKDSGDE